MKAIPPHWTKAILKDCCLRPEYGFTASASSEAVGSKFLRITDIQDGEVDWTTVPYVAASSAAYGDFKLKQGDIVIARIGATTGKAFLIDNCPDALFASYLIRIRTKPGTSPEFVNFYLQSDQYWNQINQSKGGRLKGGVNIPILENLSIPLPPLEEQRAIAHVLQTVQKARKARQRELALERERKAALMEHLFTHGTRGEQTKQTEIGEIPESWQVKPFDDLVTKKQYGLSVRGQERGEVAILRMNNLVEGKIDASDLQQVDIDAELLKAFKLERGDLLFNRTNSQDLVGKTSLFESDDPFVFASYLIRLRIDIAQAIPAFVNSYLNRENVVRQVQMLATRGVSQSNISASKLGRFPLPVPPISEQREIAAAGQACDRKIETLDAERERLEELFNAMLEELMSGRLSGVPLVEEHQPQ